MDEVEARLKAAEAALPDGRAAFDILRAELLALQGRRADAAASLDAASRRDPARLEYRIARAGLELRGDPPDARAALKILDQAAKDLGPRVGIELARIDAIASLPPTEASVALGGLAEAARAAGEADRPALLDRLASAYYRVGDFDKAGEILAELGRLRPDDLKVLLEQADAALARNDQPRLREVVGRIKDLEGEEGYRWRYVEASALILKLAAEPAWTRAPMRAAAEALVKDLLGRRKDWWGGSLLRGRLAELDGRLDEAATSYARALEAGASQPDLARRTVLLLSELGRMEDSDRIAQLLSLRDPAFEGLKLSEARNALKTGDYDRAVTLTREVIPETSAYAQDLLYLGRVLASAGRHAEAGRPLARALELAPARGDVWIAWVRHLLESGREAEIPAALARAEKAVDPKIAPLTLAIARSSAGDDAGAAALFASALKADPNDLATVRAAAEFYVKVLDAKAAAPLVGRLLDPGTGAGPEAVAWARRASALLALAPGDPKRIEEAIALVDENLKASPLSAEDRRARAILLTMHPGRQDEGVVELEALHAKHRLGREDRFLLARLSGDRGDQARRKAIMAELLAEPNPELPHILASARWDLETGDPAAAAKALDLARPRTPAAELAVLEARCRLLLAENKGGQVPTLVASHAAARPEQAGSLGLMLESLGLHADAERRFLAYAALAPNDPTRKLVLAQFLARRDRLDEAVAICEGAAAAAPPDVLAAVAMGLLGGAKSPTAEHEARLATIVEQAVSRAPDSPGLLVQLALLRARQKRFDDAERVYESVLALAPDHVGALNDFAWMLGSQGKDLDRAKRLVDRALEIVGPEASPLDTRAMIHLKRKDAAAAIRDLDAALALAPRKAVLHVRRAEALLMAERREEALESLQAAESLGVALSPSDREEIDKLARKLK